MPKHTVGEALKQALTDCAAEWTIPATATQRPAGDTNPNQRGRGQDRTRERTPRRREDVKGKNGRKGDGRSRTPPPPPMPSAERVRTVQHHKGKPICKPWNDPRGCSEPCPFGKIHVCDVAVGNGKEACGKENHNRASHRY